MKNKTKPNWVSEDTLANNSFKTFNNFNEPFGGGSSPLTSPDDCIQNLNLELKSNKKIIETLLKDNKNLRDKLFKLKGLLRGKSNILHKSDFEGII